MNAPVPRVGQRVALQAERASAQSVVQDVLPGRVAVLGPEEVDLRAALRPGADVELSFHDGHALYRCRYRVERWQHGAVTLLWLAGPLEAVRLQRRRHVRLDVEVPVTVELADGLVAGRTLDLSAGGLAGAFRGELPVGEEVAVALDLPGQEVRGRARVLRRLVRPEGAPPAYALEFVELGEREREAIYRLIFHEMRLRQQKGLLRPRGE